MSGKKVIEIPLPEDSTATGAEIDEMKSLLAAIVSLRCAKSRKWEQVLAKLHEEGWSVSWGLEWHARARRGADFEEATGKSKDEAFADLYQQTLLDRVQGCT